jgi:hypothetical protein
MDKEDFEIIQEGIDIKIISYLSYNNTKYNCNLFDY